MSGFELERDRRGLCVRTRTQRKRDSYG